MKMESSPELTLPHVTIFTDGGCEPNPGTGGWGAVILPQGQPLSTMAGFERSTTNNRMELIAAIAPLEALSERHRVVLKSDSRYLVDGATSWLAKWKKNGWVTRGKRREKAKGEPVKNVDLWQRIDALCGRHVIVWRWVKGHSGDRFNTMCDQIASQQIQMARGAQGKRYEPPARARGKKAVLVPGERLRVIKEG